ncbi:MAG TPA: hypothetical protein VNU97_13940 [Rhizomicrobium sp.]|jgi:hypothetical protein|nr:hypothetical protein [Rhizomicrobium sp.]
MRLLLPATLLAAALTLGGAIAYEALAPLDPVAVETPRLPLRATQTAMAAPYTPPPEELYADIDARPLFAASRQPLADATQPNAAAAATSDFTLVGVIMGGARAVALLRLRSTAATTSAVVGGMVNGWRVARIDATSVTLSANGSQFVVPLDGPANRAPSAPLQPLTQDQPSAAPALPPPHPSADTEPLPVLNGTPPARPAAAPAPTASAAPAKPVPPRRDPTIAPQALIGAPIDPTTGQPTL